MLEKLHINDAFNYHLGIYKLTPIRFNRQAGSKRLWYQRVIISVIQG